MRVALITLAVLVSGCSEQLPTLDPVQVPAGSDITVVEPVEPERDISSIPDRCKPYVDYYLAAKNPAREGALTEQESGCNPFAESPFAKGLRQITKETGEWLSLTHCKHLGPYDPFNEDWSLKCGINESERLQENNDFGSYCLNRKVAEQEYNGGAWVIWELKAAGENSLSAAEVACRTTGGIDGKGRTRKRAEWACKENYDYPRHIDRRVVKYTSLGGDACLMQLRTNR